MTTSILIEQELESLNISFGAALHHNALLFKRMIAAGLDSRVAQNHLERFKALLTQQKELGEVLQRDLSACKSFMHRSSGSSTQGGVLLRMPCPLSDLLWLSCSPRPML
jgi:hypothetical protein